jgi:hypothetical protein
MKFVPSPKMTGRRGRIRQKINGEFKTTKISVTSCPNVWGFKRASWLMPDESFFMSDAACWGNHEAGCKITGLEKTVCTMLLAIRILYYLGAREIYLVGVDFRMEVDNGYSFGQSRTNAAVESNNHQFRVVNNWLTQMQSSNVFGKFGLSIYNCYERSGLRAFPYLPFSGAITRAKGLCESSPNLIGWYDK